MLIWLDGYVTGERFTEKQYELVESAAEMLYGMIHARYILTSQGLASMVKKAFLSFSFFLLTIEHSPIDFCS